jgi:ribosomal protein L14E/L6E/L27E
MPKGGLTVNRVGERPIEVGRVCVVVWGEQDYRKLVIITDLIDRNRVQVDGVGGLLSNITRQSYPIRRLQTTKFQLNIPKDIHPKILTARVQKARITALWRKSEAGRRHETQRRRASLNDFGRWKLYYVKGQFKKAVASELLKLRAAALKSRVAAEGKAEVAEKITPQSLAKRDRQRAKVNPVLRRVVGKFNRKLTSKVSKRNMKLHRRTMAHKKYFRSPTQRAARRERVKAAVAKRAAA